MWCPGGAGRSGREQVPARRVPAVGVRPVGGRVVEPGRVGRPELGLLGQRPLARSDTAPLVSTVSDSLNV